MGTKRLPNRILSAFVCDNRGSAFVIFALALLPSLMMIGAATDYTRLATARSSLQKATDSAVLTIISKLDAAFSLEIAQKQAQAIINADPKLSTATVTNATISADKQTFCVTAQLSVKNVFMQIAHVGDMTASATACANLARYGADETTYEIALVLDNTLSMSSRVSEDATDPTTKIDALKSAATNFVNTLFTRAPGKVKMSVVPFMSDVRAVDPTDAANRALPWIDLQGANSMHWLGFGGQSAANAAGFTNRFDIFDKLKQRNAELDWQGCFEEPPYPYNVNADSIDTSNPESLMAPHLSPDEYDYISSQLTYDYLMTNSYTDDNGVGSDGSRSCSDDATDQWSKLNHVCKYNLTTPLIRSDPFIVPWGITVAYYGSFYRRGSNKACSELPSQTLLRLTSIQSTILDKINGMTARGTTNLHIGIMWGWRSISPNLPFAQGSSYKAPKNRKVIIFMTDGMNVWEASSKFPALNYDGEGFGTYNGAPNKRLSDGSWQGGDGVDYQSKFASQDLTGISSTNIGNVVGRDPLDQLTLEACENVKARGIEVFTIGVSGAMDPMDARGLNLMKTCATNSDHYFFVDDSAKLLKAFTSIGNALGKLHLTQ